MITLFCDLDNTIVYSHRRELTSAKRVAEMLNGIPQSYITERTFNYLSSCQMVSFIPVTTRTLTQYKRLETTLNCLNCEYAIILNGAVLIRNGEIDKDWLSESKESTQKSIIEMNRAFCILKKNSTKKPYFDEFLTYVSVADPQNVAKQIESEVDMTLLNIFNDSRKVYCTPAAINKGNAVKRFSSIRGSDITIGAGDCLNDVSMLNNVDIAIVPESLAPYVSNVNKVIVPPFEIMSDTICLEIEKLIHK